jgi:streptogramin lyase
LLAYCHIENDYSSLDRSQSAFVKNLPAHFVANGRGFRGKHHMTMHHQPGTGNVARIYLKQRRFSHVASSVSKSRARRVITMLAIVGIALLLWSQPVAAASTITEFKVPSPGIPQGITAGSDGALWFTLFYDDEVGRVTPKGAISVFRLNTMNSATYITAGNDGALWLTLLNDVGGSTTNQIGRLTTSGKLSIFTVPKASYIWDITSGPDGNLYFTDGASRVWRVTKSGHFTAFPFTDSTGGYPWQIASGPDGNLWFTDRAGLIVKMTTAGKFTTFKVPRSNGSTDDIAAGPDGNLWFTLDGTNTGSKIGRITPSGNITEFAFPGSGNDYLYMSGISAGPDRNLWFTYQDFTSNANAIGRITTGGAITLFPTPTASSGPTDITAGPDGAMWFTEAAGNVGRITTS